jgi:hypothetical protein
MPKSPVPKRKPPQSVQFVAAAKKRKRKHKSMNAELAERRQEVIRLRLKGLTLREIGKEMSLGYMTVKRDLDAIKQDVGEKVSKFDRDFALGKSISVYEQIEDEAWKQYYGCAPGSTGRAQFLNVARTARNDQVKLLCDVGLINKAPMQHEHKIESNRLLSGWTEDAKRIVSLAIIRSQMEQGVPPNLIGAGDNGKSKVIDVSPDLVTVPPEVKPT